MTNETAVAVADGVDVGERLVAGLKGQVDEGHQLLTQATAWLSARGIDFALNLAAAALILLLGWLAIRWLTPAIVKVLTRGGRRQTLFTVFAESVVGKGLWAVLIIMVLGRLGVNVGPLIAGLGVTGFILGFAFQESLGNLASGLMIALNEPFRVGDFVEIAGLAGTVKSVNIMATELATPDNKKLVVPNKNAWGQPIVNYTALGRRRVEVVVGVAYGVDLARAVAVAAEAVAAVPGVLADPAPAVVPTGFGDSAITLAVRPWAAVADYWAVYAATMQALKTAFEREGISIPFPQMDVHLDRV